MLNLTKSHTIIICRLLHVNYTLRGQIRTLLKEERKGGGGGKEGGREISDLREEVWETRLVRGKGEFPWSSLPSFSNLTIHTSKLTGSTGMFAQIVPFKFTFYNFSVICVDHQGFIYSRLLDKSEWLHLEPRPWLTFRMYYFISINTTLLSVESWL